ncbi:RluA family pseudouridine synthase [Desulfohalovibrio reitneri]|uniref:RluA family pseudouridine synthase n=1 Tax=Desulfohalovibrio reitneri TaxID=1307759 RepID=UPI0004A75793|nr:RluA family pseudouridine synthase [Desulfohalovibrio reitneri]
MSARTVTVSRAEAGCKLVDFLQRRVGEGVPRGAVMKWVRTGQVRVDGGRAKPFRKLREGEKVRIPPHTPATREEKPRPPLEIVFQNEDVLAVAKPRGLPTQRGAGWNDSVADRMRAMFPGADYPPAPAHRLDKDTTGLLLAGRSHASQRWLHRLFEERGVGKRYLAWVAGKWPHSGETEVVDKLEKGAETGEMEKMRVTESGREARAVVRPLLVREDATLVEVELLTGRTHQIRVQLASRGHPLLGDRKYGAPPHATPLMLHAWRLELPCYCLWLDPDWAPPHAWPTG